MRSEALSANPYSRIRFLAVNAADTESAIDLAVEGKSLPVVQDTLDAGTWAAWGTVMDDLVVLDAEGRALGLTNLKAQSLFDVPEYDAFLDYLRLAAGE